jgi:dihydroxy-acid dehydratase
VSESRPAAGLGVFGSPTSYGDPAFSSFIRRAFLASAGFDQEDLGRPVVGIADTSSAYATCHRGMPEVVRAVARGVEQAGGLPLVFPTVSLGEILTSPTTMLYRNLAAMATEELIRSQPMDAVVLVGGCDKTVPAHLMAAASADVPALCVVTGPMLSGSWRGERLGACTDCRRLWADHRGGVLGEDEITEVRDELCPTAGTCMVMGSASTMACLTEALGLMLPGGATPPSPTGERLRHSVASGRAAVGLERRPSEILTRSALGNALVVLAALGGSTNAVIHLLAIARRVGHPLTLGDVGEAVQDVPVLVDCRPVGSGYMEDFHRAGGMPVLLKVLEPLLDLSCTGVAGLPLSEVLAAAPPAPGWQSTIRSLDDPVAPTGGLVVLRGSLAPDGAILKLAAASSDLLEHRGPALVIDSPADVAHRLDDNGAAIGPDHVLVLRNAGPVGAGMPEVGSLPIPRHLAEAGVRDMVRITDGRMSGTAYGTVVLHCSPEAARGGPLALVRDGDTIELDARAGRLDLLVPQEELDERARHWTPPSAYPRGWLKLHAEHVLPSHLGADLDFLTAFPE